MIWNNLMIIFDSSNSALQLMETSSKTELIEEAPIDNFSKMWSSNYLY